MEMNAQIAQPRDVSSRPRTGRAVHRADRMRNRRDVSWWFRIRLALSLVLGAAWGFFLGIIMVRINAQLSVLGVVGAAMPLAFAGSMIIGLLFNRLARAWHKVARLLAALVTVAVGLPIGLIGELIALQLDAAQLVNATGALIWNLEGLLAIAGLVGGMWPGWTRPFLRLLGKVPQGVLELVARFFEWLGHVFLWAPRQMLRTILAPFQVVRSMWMPRPAPRRGERQQPIVPEMTRRPRRSRLPKWNLRSARSHSNNGNGPRVVGVVEDRCPYCFDIVKRNDRRGVRVCEVCGTPHHADCWSITGKCQVPHLNT